MHEPITTRSTRRQQRAPRLASYATLISLAIGAALLLPKVLPAPAAAEPVTTSSPASTDTASPATPTTGSPTTATVPSAEEAAASRALNLLRDVVIAPAEQIDYDEGIYGPKWADITHSGCDTRNTILKRDLLDVKTKPGTHDCVVLSGTLHDAYTGQTVPFKRVSGGFQPVQIDHVVPRATAAAHGALRLSAEQRLQFANDPLNLQTTTANQKKGNRGPAAYMPTPAYACTYAIRYVEVSAKYSLSIDAPDHAVLEQTLTRCSTTSPG